MDVNRVNKIFLAKAWYIFTKKRNSKIGLIRTCVSRHGCGW